MSAERSPAASAAPAPATRLEALWVLALALGAVLPCALVLATGHTLVWGDTAALFGPVRPLLVEYLRDLRLPLWNPYEAFGIPLHAQMIHAALHPISVLAAWLAPGTGMDLFVVANVAVAAVGAGLLARSLGATRSGALVAGYAYALSGYLLGIGAVLQYQTAAATAPWAVAALRRAGRAGWRGIGIGGLGVGCLHLAGDPQWTIVAAALGLLLAADAGGLSGAGRALAGITLGTFIGAAQLLPTWTFLAHSERAGGLSQADRLQWAFSPWRLLELFAPGFFAGRASEHLRAPVFLWLGGQTQSRLLRPFVPGVFLGASTLVLALLGGRTGRTGRILAAAALAVLWLALGHRLGAQQLLQWVPVWGSFRYSEKLVGPLSLCVALLAGLGADELQRTIRPRWGIGLMAMAVVAAAVALGLLVLPVPKASAGTVDPDAIPLAASQLGFGLLHAAVGLAALALVLLDPRLRAAGRRVRVGPLLAGLTAAAGWAAAPYVLHAGARGVVDPEPLAAIRAGAPVTRIATPLADPPFPNPLGLGPADRDVAARSRFAAAPFNVPSRIDQVDTYTGLTPRRLIRFAERFGPDAWTALRRYGLTHVVIRPPTDQALALVASSAASGGFAVLTSPEWQYSVYAVPHRGWARFASRVLPVADESDALETVAAYELSGIDATVVEGAAPPVARGRVLSAQRGRDWLRIEAEADGPALLVVADSFWPGWMASLDGKPAAVLQADYLVRGVPFPAGRHRLEMRYEPLEARIGLWLSGAGTVVALGLALLRRRREPGRLAAA